MLCSLDSNYSGITLLPPGLWNIYYFFLKGKKTQNLLKLSVSSGESCSPIQSSNPLLWGKQLRVLEQHPLPTPRVVTLWALVSITQQVGDGDLLRGTTRIPRHPVHLSGDVCRGLTPASPRGARRANREMRRGELQEGSDTLIREMKEVAAPFCFLTRIKRFSRPKCDASSVIPRAALIQDHNLRDAASC